MGMLSSNALTLVATRGNVRIQPNEIMDVNEPQAFYRPSSRGPIISRSKRDDKKRLESAPMGALVVQFDR